MEEKKILEKIKSAGLKLTKPRLAVVEVLKKNTKKFLAVEEIFETLKDGPSACDLTSIYRTLTSLEEIGVVERGDFFGEASRYRLVGHEDHHHHHHHYFKCSNCAMVEVLCGDCNIINYEKDLKKRGFSQLNHRLEFSGLCPSCSK